MLTQARASDQWAYYQAKGIKQAIYASQAEALSESNPQEAGRLRAEANRYRRESRRNREAREGDRGGCIRGRRVRPPTRACRAPPPVRDLGDRLQIAIALAAIAALTRRKALWYVSLAVGMARARSLVRGFAGV